MTIKRKYAFFFYSYRSDLPANELVQRHKISSRGSSASITSMSSMSGSPSPFGTGQETMPSHLNLTSSSSANSSSLLNNNGRYTPSPARSFSNIPSALSPHRNLGININAAMCPPQHVLLQRTMSSHIGPIHPQTAGANARPNPFGFGFDDGMTVTGTSSVFELPTIFILASKRSAAACRIKPSLSENVPGREC